MKDRMDICVENVSYERANMDVFPSKGECAQAVIGAQAKN